MSDIPKYTYWYLSGEERKRLAAIQKAEEERLEKLRLEEAERRRKERLANFQKQLQEEIQLHFRTIENLGDEFHCLSCQGGEGLEALGQMLGSFSEELKLAAWEEDAVRVEKKLEKLEQELQKLIEFLGLKKKVLREVRETKTQLNQRHGLAESPAGEVLLSEFELDSLSKSIQREKAFGSLRETLEQWQKNSDEFQRQFLLFDQRKRFAEIARSVSGWDRQLLTGEKMHDFQQLDEQMNELRLALEKERAKSIQTAFLQVENQFSALSLKLQNDSRMLEERRRENAVLLNDFAQKWSQTLEKVNVSVRQISGNARDSVSSDAVENGKFPFLNSFVIRIETQLERLRLELERQSTEQFTQSIDRLEGEMEEFSEIFDRLTSLEDLKVRLENRVPAALWEHLAAEESQHLEKKLETLAKQVQNRQCACFESEFQELQAWLDAVLERIQPKIQEWNLRREAIQKTLNEVQDAWALWFTDPEIVQWAEPELAAQVQSIEEIQALLDSNSVNPEEAEERILAWRSKMEQIAEAVRNVREKELKRQNLVSRFQEEFRQLGFSSSAPTLEDPENPASGIVLSASRPEGKTINVRFDHDSREPVLYAVDGFPMPQQNVEGKDYRTCDEAQRQLTILHQLLAKHGILMGKIQWEDQLPVDLAKEVMELPETADRTFSN